MGITTVTCPNCHTVVNVDNAARDARVLHCDKCNVMDVPLYSYHADGKDITLCLACIQKAVFALAQHAPGTAAPGPSEFK